MNVCVCMCVCVCKHMLLALVSVHIPAHTCTIPTLLLTLLSLSLSLSLSSLSPLSLLYLSLFYLSLFSLSLLSLSLSLRTKRRRRWWHVRMSWTSRLSMAATRTNCLPTSIAWLVASCPSRSPSPPPPPPLPLPPPLPPPPPPQIFSGISITHMRIHTYIHAQLNNIAKRTHRCERKGIEYTCRTPRTI